MLCEWRPFVHRRREWDPRHMMGRNDKNMQQSPLFLCMQPRELYPPLVWRLYGGGAGDLKHGMLKISSITTVSVSYTVYSIVADPLSSHRLYADSECLTV